MDGWGKIKPAATYAGISERTLRDFLKQGLKHSRLPTGRILIRFSDIDEYLEKFCVDENRVDRIVEEMIGEIPN